MRRYQLILGGTAAGIAGVLAFPTRSAHLTVPSTATGGTGPTATAGGSGTAGPAGPSSPTAGGSGTGGSGTGGSGTGGSGTGGAGTGPGSSGGAARSATGATQSFPYGDIAVRVTVSGTTITHVGIAGINEPDGHSAAIDSYAVPQLEQQVLAANSANISGISGATFTSQAFVDSLASALGQLGFRG